MSVESLAQALLEAGILDATSAEMRMSRARSPRALIEGIIADGLVTENSLVSQFARALGMPRYDPAQRRPEPEALTLLDLRHIEALGALPVALRGGGGLLWVAMCDPTDEPTLAELAVLVGRRIKPCLIGPREFARAVKQLNATPSEPQRTEAFPTSVVSAAAYVMNANSEPMVSPPQVPNPHAAGVTQRMVQPSDTSQRRPLPTTGQMTPSPMDFSNSGSASNETIQKLEEALEQARQVVRILSQMLVEQGVLDGDEFKRRLRAERERK